MTGTCPECFRPVALTRCGKIARHGWKASQPSTDLRGFDVGRDHTETRPACGGSGKPPYVPASAEAKERITARAIELAGQREKRPTDAELLDTLTSFADGEGRVRNATGMSLAALREWALDRGVEKCPSCGWWAECGEMIPDGSDDPDGFCANCREGER